MHDDDVERDAPGTVVGAVAAGTAPLPFLAVYSVMFIVHGGFHPVVPPDITGTQHGELVAGIVTSVLFIASCVALLWMLSGARRWPFVAVQLATLAAAIDFVVDSTRGGGFVAVVLIAATAAALVLSFLPPSWSYYRHSPRRSPDPASGAAPGRPEGAKAG